MVVINEEETEAAAATDSQQIVVTGYRHRVFEMIFNRPFLLAIRDITDGRVLFMALVRNPGEDAV
jgi:serine protease inhibitor